MPCSRSSAIDLKMRMGIDSTAAKDPLEYEHIAYSEKLTLERIWPYKAFFDSQYIFACDVDPFKSNIL